MFSADIVLMAIQAGVKLYGGQRESYIVSIKQAAITLPVPAVSGDDFGPVAVFVATVPTPIEGADGFRAQRAIVLPIAQRFEAGQDPTEAERQLAFAFRDRWFPVFATAEQAGQAPAANPADTPADAVLALLVVRQWSKDRPAWQIAAGTLIDVAVSWFANAPGAVATNRPEGKALKAFLQSLATIDFAHTTQATLAADILVAVLDTVAKQPRLIAGGKREEALVTAVSSSLAGAIGKIPSATLEGMVSTDRDQISAALQGVAAAALRAAADTVLTDPKLFFVGNANTPETKIVGQIGKIFIDLILPTTAGGQGKIDLAAAVSASGLETLLRASLAAVGNNPGILHFQGDAEKRLTPLLADLAAAFSKAALPTTTQAAFAGVAALVIGATDRHIDVLWPNANLDPAANLARNAVIAVLGAIDAGGAGSGLAAFATKDIVAIADAAIASIADNPALMKIAPGGGPYLGVALTTVLQALKKQSVATIGPDAALAIVVAGLSAAARKLPLFQTSAAGPAIALGKTLDTVFAALAEIEQTGNDAAKWRAAANSFVVGAIEATLAAAADLPGATGPTDAAFGKLKIALIAFVGDGLPLSDLPAIVATALAQ